ncbi:MAG: OmpA family protein, partial [Polyangiales bacterium]
MAKGLLTFGESEMEGGFAASHPLPSLPIYAAPSTRDEFETSNKLKLSLNPVACWRLDDARFEFDSSFVMPEAKNELATLAKMIKLQRDAPLSIFGHTDPVGQDDYNIVLGARRARSIHCILMRNVDGWVDLYDHPFQGDDWKSKKVVGTMLGALGFSSKKEDIEAFQASPKGVEKGLKVDGDPGPNTRKALIEAYMEFLFELALTKEAFLGMGKNDKGKGDFQACGEFNPILLLSKDEVKALTKAQRDVENSPNRRVVVFFYEPGTQVEPDLWPCPAAPMKQGEAGKAIAKCKERFWSDHQERREPAQDERRAFKETHDTFACRFYHRMAGWSPCEGGQVVRHWVIRVLTPEGAPPYSKAKPLANAPFVASVQGGGGKRTVGQTDDAGILRIRVHEEATKLTLKLGDDLVLELDAGALKKLEAPDDPDIGAKQRLFNLGYGTGAWPEWKDAKDFIPALTQFQKNEKV